MSRFMLRLALFAAMALTMSSVAFADDEENEFGDPKKSTVVQVGVMSTEEPKEDIDLNDPLVKKLVEASRGGKSSFPKEVAEKYEKLLAKGATTNASEPSKSILAFASKNLGKKVGNGQCAVLNQEALKAAKCKEFPPYGADKDYIWGKKIVEITKANIKDASKIKPGHLLQYRNAEFSGKVTIPNGYYNLSSSAAHHSSIVRSINGSLVSVYESNSGGVLTTQVGYFDLAHMKRGTIWVYEATK